jgi:hypothetical protein
MKILVFKELDGLEHHSIYRYVHLEKQYCIARTLKQQADEARGQGAITDHFAIKKLDKARQIIQEAMDDLSRGMFTVEPMARKSGIETGYYLLEFDPDTMSPSVEVA